MKEKKNFLTVPVIALVMLSFFLGTSEFIVVGILPEISEGLGISLTQAGNIVSIFAFTYALGTPFFAALAGKYNRYRYMILCIGIFALTNLLCALAPVYILFLAARIIMAVVSGTIISVSMTFAQDITEPENMPKVIAAIFSGFSIASVFGVPITTAITHTFGWRAAFCVIFAATVCVTLVLAKTLPKTSSRKQSTGLFRQFVIFKDKRILLGVAMVLLTAAASYTFYTYLTPIFQDELHIPESLVSIALLVSGVAALISNLSSGKLAERGGLKRMPGIYGIQILFLILLPWACKTPVLGFLNIFILGVLMYLMNVPVQTHFLSTAEKDYPQCMSLASSFQSVFFNFGIAAGSACGGLIVDHGGMMYVSYGGAVLAAAACICCLVLLKVLKK